MVSETCGLSPLEVKDSKGLLSDRRDSLNQESPDTCNVKKHLAGPTSSCKPPPSTQKRISISPPSLLSSVLHHFIPINPIQIPWWNIGPVWIKMLTIGLIKLKASLLKSCTKICFTKFLYSIKSMDIQWQILDTSK